MLIQGREKSTARRVSRRRKRKNPRGRAQILVEERIAYPILLGKVEVIQRKAVELGVDLQGMKAIDPERPLAEMIQGRNSSACEEPH
jgi:phosphotransacetylase